jgi:hypothetical protein
MRWNLWIVAGLVGLTASCGGGGGGGSGGVLLPPPPTAHTLQGTIASTVAFNWGAAAADEFTAGGEFVDVGQYNVPASFFPYGSTNDILQGTTVVTAAYASHPAANCGSYLRPGSYFSHAAGLTAGCILLVVETLSDHIACRIVDGTETFVSGSCPPGTPGVARIDLTLVVENGSGRWANATGTGTLTLTYNRSTNDAAGSIDLQVFP